MAEGRKFTTSQKREIRKEQQHTCPGCGREFPTERRLDPRQKMLEVHHKKPKSLGGGNERENGVGLCGPQGCHEIFNRLALKYKIPYEEVVRRFGEMPLRRHKRLLKEAPERVERRLVRQIRRRAA